MQWLLIWTQDFACQAVLTGVSLNGPEVHLYFFLPRSHNGQEARQWPGHSLVLTCNDSLVSAFQSSKEDHDVESVMTPKDFNPWWSYYLSLRFHSTWLVGNFTLRLSKTIQNISFSPFCHCLSPHRHIWVVPTHLCGTKKEISVEWPFLKEHQSHCKGSTLLTSSKIIVSPRSQFQYRHIGDRMST